MEIALIGSIATTMAVIAAINWSVNQKVNAHGGCPECHTPVPLYRRPTSMRQALRGGWTCESCETEIDRYGAALR